MRGPIDNQIRRLADDIAVARRKAAVAQAELATACVEYADARIASDRTSEAAERGRARAGRARPGEFVADEVSLLLREQPFATRRLVARARRMAAALPTVWQAFRMGDLDAEQIRVIDRVARRVTEAHTLAAIDDEVVEAAQTRCPKQLGSWLLRLVVRLEPLAFEQRHRRALAERRVTVVQGADGMGYVTGEVSAADAGAIDATLAAAARSLGADDPRNEQQRRSDLFADLLLGRLGLAEPSEPDAGAEAAPDQDWLEMEDIDPETGELLGTRWQRIDSDGEVVGEPVDEPPPTISNAWLAPPICNKRSSLRIGVVVPLSSLLGLSECPGELADRSGLIPGQELRDLIADAVGSDSDRRDQVLFTRLLTDDGGRLLDVTELGRYASARLAQAIKVRAGTCRYPTCTVPAERCDLDHHEPVPKGPTSAANLDPLCRRHHRGKTFAWLASVRDDHGVDWTMPDAERYRCVDDPLPTGLAA
jgi:Domain of unknown function (DUF222)